MEELKGQCQVELCSTCSRRAGDRVCAHHHANDLSLSKELEASRHDCWIVLAPGSACTIAIHMARLVRWTRSVYTLSNLSTLETRLVLVAELSVKNPSHIRTEPMHEAQWQRARAG